MRWSATCCDRGDCKSLPLGPDAEAPDTSAVMQQRIATERLRNSLCLVY
jgi:hypothetical protein